MPLCDLLLRPRGQPVFSSSQDRQDSIARIVSMTEITAAAIAPAVLSINGGGGAGGILLGADCRDVPVLGTGLMLSPCIK